MASEATDKNSQFTLPWLWLGVLFVVALAARFINLGRADVWCDEILFINLSSASPLAALKGHYQQFLSIGHLPSVAMLQAFGLWLVTPFSGANPDAFWLRLPSALWSALAVIPLARLGALVAGRSVGMMAGLMAALFFFPIYYGREVYYYAGLVMFAAFALHGWFAIAAGAASGWRAKVITCVAIGAMTSAHVTGVLVTGVLLLTSFVWLVKPPRGVTNKVAWDLALVSLVGITTCLPFFLQRLGNPSPMNFVQLLTGFEMVRDGIGKQFFGTHALPLAFACVLLLAGAVAAFLWRDERRSLRITLLVLITVVFTAITLSSLKTLFSPRYFNIINGPLYLLAAIGIQYALRTFIPARAAAAGIGVAAAICIAQAAVFFPSLYALTAKGVDYGGIKRAIEANFKPGTPYVMESGYETRFCGSQGYFATSNHLSAVPYIHGEVSELWSRQTRFLERHPHAVYVESAHHGSNPRDTTGIFAWPHTNFLRRIELVNRPLIRLAELGMWPQANDDTGVLVQSRTTLFYNTPEDRMAMARTNGIQAIVEYPGWTTRMIQQFEYVHTVAATVGHISVINLTTEFITGELEMPIALFAPAHSTHKVELLQENIPLGSPLTHTGGRFNTLNTGVIRFAPGVNNFTIRVAPDAPHSAPQAIAIPGCLFIPK